MKIGFFTEGGYTGKIPRDFQNMRTDAAWVCALDATYHPILTLHELPADSYDIGIIIIPKKKVGLFEYPVIEMMKKVCKKICTMQESTYWYWQDDTAHAQVWYHDMLQSMDLILCHNDIDLKYYRGITDVRCELMPSVMIVDNVKEYAGEKKGVMTGGNWNSTYRGFDSYLIGKILSDDVSAITTGRIKPDEKILDITHLPWMPWVQWMHELSKRKYGVQLGTASAGTINLNCAYLGIPCIGYDSLNTQKALFPDLSVPDGDVQAARKLAEQLIKDEALYNWVSLECKKNYRAKYSESVYIKKMGKILNSL